MEKSSCYCVVAAPGTGVVAVVVEPENLFGTVLVPVPLIGLVIVYAHYRYPRTLQQWYHSP